MDSEAGLTLLALDGGGIRGLSELLILEELMTRIKAKQKLKEVPRPCEYFDMIGGTGTGGIIAILLGRLRMSIQEAIEVYNDLASRIFSKRKLIWKDGRFKASALEAAMKEIIARYDPSGKEKFMMSEASKLKECKTFVCAMPAQNMAHPRLFRSYGVHSGQGHNAEIWEIARATSAAPKLFKRIFIGTEPKEEFVDGGLRCNNPTAEVLREAQNLYGMDHPISCIVSIGTGHPDAITLQRSNIFQRLLPTNLMDVLVSIATDCEKLSDDFEKTYGEGNRKREKKTYFRLNVQQGLQNIGLEEWTKMSNVKTHTVQYMMGAAVDVGVDRVVDVLRMRRMRSTPILEEPQLV